MTQPNLPHEESTGRRRDIAMRYPAPSQVSMEGETDKLDIAANSLRDPVHFRGRILEPLLFREALSALYAVVSADFRYVPKDRTAYMAYQRLRKSSAKAAPWQAQQAYFDWLADHDPLAWFILDPVITVHPDALFFEVFSKDEGCYARLRFDREAFATEGDPVYGTTNIDFSESFYSGLQDLREFRISHLTVGTDAVALEHAGGETAVEKKVGIPLSWLRGFLQLQSAGLLPRTVIRMEAVDLYNLLRHLRLHADRKKGGRAIRVELTPGEPVRLVLEPWNKVLPLAMVYKGLKPRIIRIWGRRRLMLLERILPFATEVHMHLCGSGLPTWFTVKAGPATFTLAVTGFTASDWSRACTFDLLMPRRDDNTTELQAVIAHLDTHFAVTVDQLSKALKLKKAAIMEAVQRGCQQGLLFMEDKVCRRRPLTEQPLMGEDLRFRNPDERRAYDLLAAGAVSIESENTVFGVGTELVGKVIAATEQREYRPLLTLDDEGRARKAECTCPKFRKHGLKQGPCPHLTALRLFHITEEDKRARGKNRVLVETRTYTKRRGEGELVYQLSLDRRQVRTRWGPRDGDLRLQNLHFESTDAARAAFLQSADRLESKGFLNLSSR
ncbi:MAG: helix-turn-helix domain-containing protein [Acidobacteriota bacterium]|nr:helix-turn-helix domain-containing protein [Acidobacteriota bacterium]